MTLAVDSTDHVVADRKVQATRHGWSMTECQACHRSSVWRDSELIYPRTSPVPIAHSDMPSAAKDLYDEARDVFTISKRASAALGRAALESLLRAQDPMDGQPRLDDRIAHLRRRVSQALWQVLTALRVIGNETLHADQPEGAVALYLAPESEQTAELLFRAMNDLVDELISKPKSARNLYSLLPDDVRKVAEAKAARATED